MADILSSGREPGGPHTHRTHGRHRWLALLAGGLIVAAVASSDVQADDRTRQRPATFRLDGEAGTGPAGVRLLIGGQQPGVLDIGSGRLTALPVPVSHGDVAELDHAGGTTTVLLHNVNRQMSRGFAIEPGGKVDALGPVSDLVPTLDGGVIAEECGDDLGSGRCTLTEYSAAGARRWTRILSRKLDLIRDTPSGLVVGAYEAGAGRLVRLENVQTGAVYRVVGRAQAVLGADDRQVAYVPVGCRSNCELTLSDLDNGSSRSLPQSPGIPAVATFSENGRRLAVGHAGMSTDDPSTSAQRDGYVSVIDLAGADSWQELPDVTTGEASTALPVWSPDGRLLLAVPTDNVGSGRLVAWQPGAARVTILPVELEGFFGTPGLAAELP